MAARATELMRARRALLFFPLAALAACEATPLPAAEAVALPRGAVEGAGDPTRAAIINTSFGFGRGAPFAGEPFQAAEAVAQLEFLSNALVSDPRFSLDPLVAVRFAEARPEWRAAAGITDAAPAQPVIDNLFLFARGQARLSPALFAADAPQRLAALPRLPRTNAATSAASQLLFRLDSDRGGRGFRRF